MKIKKIIRTNLILIVLFISFLFLYACDSESSDKIYSIMLIDSINDSKLTLDFESDQISLGDIKIKEKEGYKLVGFSYTKNGEALNDEILLDIKDTPTLYSLWKKVDEINSFLIDEIARVDIYADGVINSKETYVTAQFNITSSEEELLNLPGSIKLRGNSSLNAPKKSYKIKFDKKQDIFGFGKDKEWALIANYYDPSLLRNFYAYKIAESLGMEYHIDTKFVEVYLNNEPLGLYLFCETIKTGDERINIEIKEDVNDLPFLLELDFKMISEGDPASNGIKDIDYFELYIKSYSSKTYPIATKYPKAFNEITPAQYESIKTRVKNAFKSVIDGTYEQYFNVDTLVDFFFIQELMMNVDVDHSSVFFYQSYGGKISFGPVWDFDISCGNCNYLNNYNPYILMKKVNGGSPLFNALLNYQDFKNQFRDRMTYFKNNILPHLNASFNYNYVKLASYESKDNEIWHTLNSSYWPKPDYLVGLTYLEQVNFLKSYINEHFEYMYNLI